MQAVSKHSFTFHAAVTLPFLWLHPHSCLLTPAGSRCQQRRMRGWRSSGRTCTAATRSSATSSWGTCRRMWSSGSAPSPRWRWTWTWMARCPTFPSWSRSWWVCRHLGQGFRSSLVLCPWSQNAAARKVAWGHHCVVSLKSECSCQKGVFRSSLVLCPWSQNAASRRVASGHPSCCVPEVRMQLPERWLQASLCCFLKSECSCQKGGFRSSFVLCPWSRNASARRVSSGHNDCVVSLKSECSCQKKKVSSGHPLWKRVVIPNEFSQKTQCSCQKKRGSSGHPTDDKQLVQDPKSPLC